MGKLVGFIVKAGLVVGFVFGINLLRGKQADEFHDKAFVSAMNSCRGEASCSELVNAHFETCYEQNHSSHRRGRYGREHVLDQQGFDACMAVARGMTQLADERPEAAAKPVENEELTALRAAVMADGVIDEYEAEALAEAELDAPDAAPLEAAATEAAFEAERTGLRGEDVGLF